MVANDQLDDRRPQGARDIVARSRDGDGDAAALLEPVRDVGDQRREGGGCAEADQRLGGGEQDQRRRQRREDKSEGQPEGAQDRSDDHATPVHDPSDNDATREESHHVHGVGERDVGATDAEIGLHSRDRHGQRPHADAADRAQGHAGGQPPPGVARIDTAHFCAFSRRYQPPGAPWVLTYSA